jgi:hypothetical protein
MMNLNLDWDKLADRNDDWYNDMIDEEEYLQSLEEDDYDYDEDDEEFQPCDGCYATNEKDCSHIMTFSDSCLNKGDSIEDAFAVCTACDVDDYMKCCDRINTNRCPRMIEYDPAVKGEQNDNHHHHG